MSTPKTHVLSLSNYTTHHLSPLPLKPLSSLAPSSLRIRTKLLALTTNNLSYARIGHLMGWYTVYPLPTHTPPPYNDLTAYGRVPAWGYAEVLDSTVAGIEKGMSVYGYLPSSTEWEDVRVERATDRIGKEIQGHVMVVDEHRQGVWRLYNRYRVCGRLSALEKEGEGEKKARDELGWAALMLGLFNVGYDMSCSVFSWDQDDVKGIHPTGIGKWGAEDRELRGATLVLLNASGKTAMSFAYALRYCRPDEYQPYAIIGVGSSASIGVIKKTGWYDSVVSNEDYKSTAKEIKKSGSRRIVLVDFGARLGANENWRASLSALSPAIPFMLITVGGEVAPQDPEKAAQRLANRASLNIVNASLIRERGIEIAGAKYFEELYGAWEEFRERAAGVDLLKLQWGEGLEDWKKGWEMLCKDEVRADTGLVYRI